MGVTRCLRPSLRGRGRGRGRRVLCVRKTLHPLCMYPNSERKKTLHTTEQTILKMRGWSIL